jgi:hypothetical protein
MSPDTFRSYRGDLCPYERRYRVTALACGSKTRVYLGGAPSRRKARKLGYTRGPDYCRPWLGATFAIEIIDALTGDRVRATGAEAEALKRAKRQPLTRDSAAFMAATSSLVAKAKLDAARAELEATRRFLESPDAYAEELIAATWPVSAECSTREA